MTDGGGGTEVLHSAPQTQVWPHGLLGPTSHTLGQELIGNKAANALRQHERNKRERCHRRRVPS